MTSDKKPSEWRFWLMLTIMLLILYEANQAHKHSHEAACFAGHEPTCKYVSKRLDK